MQLATSSTPNTSGSLPGSLTISTPQHQRNFALLVKRLAKSLRPPPRLKVSEWADRYRQLSRETSAEPGQWDTNRVPWAREWMDAVNDPEIREGWVMKSAQVAWTSSL